MSTSLKEVTSPSPQQLSRLNFLRVRVLNPLSPYLSPHSFFPYLPFPLFFLHRPSEQCCNPKATPFSVLTYMRSLPSSQPPSPSFLDRLLRPPRATLACRRHLLSHDIFAPHLPFIVGTTDRPLDSTLHPSAHEASSSRASQYRRHL